MKVRIIFILICLNLPKFLYSQDTINERKSSLTDSVEIYKKIKKISSKRKVTSWIYGALFREPGYRKTVGNKKPTKKTDNLDSYKGKIIKDIKIFTLDPFGANISDTTLSLENKFVNFGNALHIKSKILTIKNQLLFVRNQELDPYLIRESERILRTSVYVRDAKIFVTPFDKKNDSIDVVVFLQDQWSIGVNGSINSLDLYDNNFLGLAHQFKNRAYYSPIENIVYTGSYNVPYIRNTFITAIGYYSSSLINSQQGVTLSRQFFSPVTKWAGGIDVFRYKSFDSIQVNDTLYNNYAVKYDIQDYWAGISFKLTPGNSDFQKGARLVLAGRVFNKSYLQRLSRESDTTNIYQNSSLFLGSIGYSSRQYYKDQYIYRFGRNEDVPIGTLVALIGGIEKRELYSPYYFGAKSAIGNHINDFGYLSGAVEYGTYLHSGKPEQGVLNLNFSYFSDLFKIKKFAMRQFFYYRYTKGFDRKLNERIYINGSANGIYGYNSSLVNGTSRMSVGLENIVYTPYQLLGFHFATLAFAGFGILGDDNSKIFKSKLYQVYGFGLLIRNENLVINTIQLSFGIYPNLPGKDGIATKFNPIGSYSLKFNDFFLTRPDLVSYK